MDVAQAKRLLLIALTTSLCATAALAVGTLLLGEFDETSFRIIAATAFTFVYSLLALPGTVLLAQRRSTTLAWATITVALCALAVALALVATAWHGDDELWRLLGVLTALAAALAQAAATTAYLRSDDPPSIGALYLVANVLGFALAAMITTAIWRQIDDGGYYRLLGAVAVADVLSLLLQPTVRRMHTVTVEDAGGPPTSGEPVAAGRAGPADAFTFRCTLDRYPDAMPRGDGYAAAPDPVPIVDCKLKAPDFAAAVALAVRELEAGGANVTRIERSNGA